MTNEEAIAYAKRVIDLGLNDETQEFCELVIKVLETIPKYKDAYGKGWEDGAKATNIDCGVVWEDRIEDIKADINHLQTYKLAEDADFLLVEHDLDVIRLLFLQ